MSTKAAGRARVAVLISGRGSNMLALHDATRDPSYPAEIVGVASDKDDAPGIALANERGLETAIVPRAAFASKVEHEAALSERLAAWKPDWIVLAGYMRILSSLFLDRWRDRVLNIHPSLLPSFPGLDTHRRALDAGVRIHGCTVHVVTPGVDEGPIIAQAALAVRPDDDETALASRVLELEHGLYAQALADIVTGRARMHDGRCVRDTTGALIQAE